MKILLLGYGVVGSGVYELIQRHQERLYKTYQKKVEIVGILVKQLDKYVQHEQYALFTDDFESLVKQHFDVAIETIGGVHPAFDYVNRMLNLGKPVITSNKDLIAEKGDLLHETARKNSVALSYEASVGGGIPILKPIRECLGGDAIQSIFGIVNGTTNFILTKMNHEGLGYDEALKMAQDMGFAEADPTSDVQGLDAIRKMAILSKLGMKVSLDWKTLPAVGITNITRNDVACFKSFGLIVKLIGMSMVTEDGLYTAVRPALLESHSKFASIHNEFNGICVVGESVGELFFSGKGAGKHPTATAVLGDLVDLLQNTKNQSHVPMTTYPQLTQYPYQASWILRTEAQDLSRFEEMQGVKTLLSDDQKDGYIHVKALTESALWAWIQAEGLNIQASYLIFDK